MFREEWINVQLFMETIRKDGKIATLYCEDCIHLLNYIVWNKVRLHTNATEVQGKRWRSGGNVEITAVSELLS